MKVTDFICDIKDCENSVNEPERKIQVIFRTDQGEGKPSNPYFSIETLDICDWCMEKIFEGNHIFAWGAQGYNSYEIQDKK